MVMMTDDLQRHLLATKRYAGAVDGDKPFGWGRLTDAGVLLALTDGPDTKLVAADFDASGARLRVQPAAIRAFWQTEAAGAGFQDGKPKILPERHRFSKLTKGIFDKTAPSLSSPTWDKSWYPRTQDARYDVILAWGKLLNRRLMPIDAAFAAASWGAPQILGENHLACGYETPFAFAEAMARDEVTQLRAFEAFVTNAGILPFLRAVTRDAKSWEPVALRYNGTAFRANNYHVNMAKNFALYGGR